MNLHLRFGILALLFLPQLAAESTAHSKFASLQIALPAARWSLTAAPCLHFVAIN